MVKPSCPNYLKNAERKGSSLVSEIKRQESPVARLIHGMYLSTLYTFFWFECCLHLPPDIPSAHNFTDRLS